MFPGRSQVSPVHMGPVQMLEAEIEQFQPLIPVLFKLVKPSAKWHRETYCSWIVMTRLGEVKPGIDSLGREGG